MLYINRSLSILYRYGQRYLSSRLQEYELDVGQFPFLMRVYNHAGLTQEQMAAELGMDKGTVARGVAQLEARGLIRRRPDEHDRRINHVYPTERAEALHPAMRGIVNDLHAILYQELTEPEIARAAELIDRMTDHLRQQVDGSL
ncbi:MAG: MarR family transcriptional regulator [Oscillospiraceae bacterium]